MQLERRIQNLEMLAPAGEKLIGVPPLEFDYHTREAAFETDGFDLEQIEPRGAPAPQKLGVAIPLDYAAVRLRMRREDALRERLKGLAHAEQEKLARREGYRVIYAPEGFTWDPRIHARHA